MKAYILGIGWVDGNGPGRGRGERTCQLRPGPLPRIERRDIFATPDRRFGRLDDYSRLGLAAIALALQDAGLESWDEKRPWGIVAASRYGCLATDCDYFDTVIPDNGALTSPNLFAYTLSNCFTGEAAIRFGLTGPSYVVNEPGPWGFDCLRLALEHLADGDAPLVVAGMSDLASVTEPCDGPPETAGAVFLALAKEPLHGTAPLLENSATGTTIEQQSMADWNSLVATARKTL